MLPKVRDFKEETEEAGVELVPVMEVEEEDGEEVEVVEVVVEGTIGEEVNIEEVLRT